MLTGAASQNGTLYWATRRANSPAPMMPRLATAKLMTRVDR
jgi:hypothetical protein